MTPREALAFASRQARRRKCRRQQQPTELLQAGVRVATASFVYRPVVGRVYYELGGSKKVKVERKRSSWFHLRDINTGKVSRKQSPQLFETKVEALSAWVRNWIIWTGNDLDNGRLSDQRAREDINAIGKYARWLNAVAFPVK